MSDRDIVTIGVTGGIGSGKSTVCKTFQRLGAKWINADKLAKDLMTEDPELKAQIIKEFGTDAYRRNGLLNRAFLAKEAFNKGRVEALNRLVHPKVREAALEAVDKAREEGYEALVYEAALLLDEGRPDFLDYVVLVTADKNERVRR
ncbi:MAG: dephospho-CoA kinase, partial [Balneolaceae bacterium]